MPTPVLVLAVIAVGAVVGLVARSLLARWAPDRAARTGAAEAVLVGMLGAALGQVLATRLEIADHGADWIVFLAVGFAAAVLVSIGALVAVSAYVARRDDAAAADVVADALARGESDRVEFKSSARYNRHTGAKDARLERVLGKTVAAFANSDGGVLLVGVDDSGTVLGLDDDMALAKFPDLDRFELYLRDTFTRLLGPAAATRLRIEFVQHEGRDVCLVRVRPSPRPVFVQGAGDDLEEFWVRAGNSSRRLGPADMLAYCSSHRRFGRLR